MTMEKSSRGRFFEDFTIGETLVHATPRTVTEGDQALYTALYGARFAPQAADSLAQDIGLPAAPLDDLLVFHVIFGKSVPDISLNAVANLGYAGALFLQPVYPGDTLSATSEVIGMKENSNGKTGVVYVETVGRNQVGEVVLRFYRWVMVNKREGAGALSDPQVPELPKALSADELVAPEDLDFSGLDPQLTGGQHFWEDYQPGERIDHVDGTTIEEAEHQLATRLYHNTARVHFNLHTEAQGRFGRRIVYGGHIISIARALSFNGLENAFFLAGINGGRHSAPSFAGDTIYAWSQVLESAPLPGRENLGALRLRTVATKNRATADFPLEIEDGKLDPAVVLDLDYWVLMPRKG